MVKKIDEDGSTKVPQNFSGRQMKIFTLLYACAQPFGIFNTIGKTIGLLFFCQLMMFSVLPYFFFNISKRSNIFRVGFSYFTSSYFEEHVLSGLRQNRNKTFFLTHRFINLVRR